MSGLPIKMCRRITPASRKSANWLWLALLILVAVSPLSCGNSAKAIQVTEVYTVEKGDTLWSIADRYIAKNTYGKRDIREFYHGIIERNYETVFKNRAPYYFIYPGDNLEINYWIKVEE
ncbi:LysM domain-containing protein [Anaerospora hongkongensis]|uniref:LysM domain-containing protein n=1 Tax=Anaerospora hongkongensis TaxID=244830 RepID=A0A4V2Q941_9FIRM|nr:LysM peptidoglycan-binding domain-containing protein [Anaerospora hongkongensis]TCL40023.1 LysM domain-containing protein [Anaerospora hongkongensis]